MSSEEEKLHLLLPMDTYKKLRILCTWYGWRMKMYVGLLIRPATTNSSKSTHALTLHQIRKHKSQKRADRKGMHVAGALPVHLNLGRELMNPMRIQWGWYRISSAVRKLILQDLKNYRISVELLDGKKRKVYFPPREFSKRLRIVCIWKDLTVSQYAESVLIAAGLHAEGKKANKNLEESMDFNYRALNSYPMTSGVRELILEDLKKYDILVVPTKKRLRLVL
jgi:hypothetical protein